MTSFDVLDSAVSVHRHLLLEASAGTGKTFAIENIVLRLLLETPEGHAEPLTIDQILVSTFTKAAAKDLVERIRGNLTRALTGIDRHLSGCAADLPEYLLAFLTADQGNGAKAKRRLERALLDFDQAQIFTLHSFCWRMLRTFALEAGVSLDASSQEEGGGVAARKRQAVRDFLRTELLPQQYHSSQLKILLKAAGGNPESLVDSLCKQIDSGTFFKSYSSFAELLHQFQEAMRRIASQFEPEKIFSDFIKAAPFYNGLYDRSRQLKPAVIQKVEWFASLFAKKHWESEEFAPLIEEGIFLLEALDPSKLAAKKTPPTDLCYPHFLEVIRQQLRPIVSQAREGKILFARLAGECRQFWERCRREEELFGHQDLLHEMKETLKNPHFAEKIRAHYRAVIVDEFQDTDPIQWEILKIFCMPAWKGFFHIIGDPKQSIYAFRQADIYTYLAAADTLGKEAHKTLDCNYRSLPSLVAALNQLFASITEPFPLPKLNAALPYRPVRAGKEEKQLADGRACLQFWVAKAECPKRKSAKAAIHILEETHFFPAIAQEILYLKHEKKIAFNRFAILVADRYQGRQLEQFLEKCRIPVCNQKGIPLHSSPAFLAMKELLRAMMNYRRGDLKLLLGGRLIGWTQPQLLAMDDKQIELLFNRCQELHQLLLKKGFAYFYPRFMRSCWHDDSQSVLEKLLQQPDGEEFYSEWQEIADLLMAKETKNGLSPDRLLPFLNEYQEKSKLGEEQPSLLSSAGEEKSGSIDHPRQQRTGV